MRAVIQRTTQSQVTVDGELVGKAGAGLTVLLGVGAEDTAEPVSFGYGRRNSRDFPIHFIR